MNTAKIQLANDKSKSVRVTIPLEVKKALKLEIGDVIAFDLVEGTKDKEPFAKIRKLS